MFPGTKHRGVSLQLATCPGLSAQRSCLNQSRCGLGIPCSRHHVSPAGPPRRGALRGPRGRRGGASEFFFQLQPGAAGRRKSYTSTRCALDLGCHPHPPPQDRTCTRIWLPAPPSFLPLNDLSGEFKERRDRTSTV